MPTNLYGPGENYDLENPHVLPVLIRKMHEVKERGDCEIIVWGTSTPCREFLYSDDMVDACVMLMNLRDARFYEILAKCQPPLINVGCREEVTIRGRAETAAKVVEFECNLVFDASEPDGTPKQLLDVSRIGMLGWRARANLATGVARSTLEFRQQANE